jgi:hypothetical protein
MKHKASSAQAAVVAAASKTVPGLLPRNPRVISGFFFA